MSKIVSYFQESYEEFVTKATWPQLSTLQKSSVLVVVASIIFSLVIWAMDTSISFGLETLYSLFK
ncbi:MAG: hypothetical protein SchgKO_06940 [Schleiferiaceae bacterium]|jgi:preprotein translocase subunit SecE